MTKKKYLGRINIDDEYDGYNFNVFNIDEKDKHWLYRKQIDEYKFLKEWIGKDFVYGASVLIIVDGKKLILEWLEEEDE